MSYRRPSGVGNAGRQFAIMWRRGAVATLLLVVLTSAFPGMVSAQDSEQEIEILNIIEADSGQVAFELSLPPSVADVEPTTDNIALVENESPRNLLIVPFTEAVDVVIAIDTSQSMQGTAIGAAQQAARGFVERLPADAQVGVVAFGDQANVVSGLGTDRAATLAAIDSLVATGETALWDSLSLSADLVSALGSPRPYVVVLSDGKDTVTPDGQSEAIAKLQAADAGLYAVNIETGETDKESLQVAVDSVGGQFLSTIDVSQLDALYIDIADRLSSRIQIVYQSIPNSDRDIVVTVLHNGVISTARTKIDGDGAVVRDDVADVDADQDDAVASSPVEFMRPNDLSLLKSPAGLAVGAATIFVSLAMFATLVVIPAGRKVRLDTAVGADRMAGANARIANLADQVIKRGDSGGRLESMLDVSGINLTSGEYVALAAAVAVGLMLVISLLVSPLVGLLAMLMVAMAAFMYIRRRARKQRELFADQLVDALSMLSGSLRAGRSLPQAIEFAAEETADPIAGEFQRVVFETRVGRDLTQSLSGVGEKMKSSDFEWVAQAIGINRELGGDLTEIFENVADTIRDRRRVARQISALTAEGRATGRVLTTMPFVMFAFLSWQTPENIELFIAEELGQLLLAIAFALIGLGSFWIKRLVAPRF